jgi:hypothetical protein
MTIIIDVGSSKKARPELEMVKFKALIRDITVVRLEMVVSEM